MVLRAPTDFSSSLEISDIFAKVLKVSPPFGRTGILWQISWYKLVQLLPRDSSYTCKGDPVDRGSYFNSCQALILVRVDIVHVELCMQLPDGFQVECEDLDTRDLHLLETRGMGFARLSIKSMQLEFDGCAIFLLKSKSGRETFSTLAWLQLKWTLGCT